jgi:hypothetical protein
VIRERPPLFAPVVTRLVTRAVAWTMMSRDTEASIYGLLVAIAGL